MKVPRWIFAGLIFGGLWVFVSGAAIRVDSLLANFLVGTLIGLPVAYVFRRLYAEDVDPVTFARALPTVVLYVLVFLKEIGLASIDVTYRVLAPGMLLEPQVILVPLRVETDLGITTIANSISLTPGTVTLDHDPDENTLYVHGIDGRDPEEIVRPIRQWEDYVLTVFDEPKSPSDPAPEITVHPQERPPEPKTVFESFDDGSPDDQNGDRDAETGSETTETDQHDEPGPRSSEDERRGDSDGR